MTLAFEAQFVRCADALDGEILWVTLDTIHETENEEDRHSPYVSLSQNFEFPGPPTFEWHDGTDYDGGAQIKLVTLTRDRVNMQLDRGRTIDVTFRLSESDFLALRSFLERIVGKRRFVIDEGTRTMRAR